MKPVKNVPANTPDDGAMFKHSNNGQGIYVDPKRDFCAMQFGTAANI